MFNNQSGGDLVFKGIGKLIEAITGAVTRRALETLGIDYQNYDCDITIDDGKLTFDIKKEVQKFPSDYQFIVSQELRKQENLDKIIAKALSEIVNVADEKISDVSVNETWMLQFLNSSKYATEEEVQNLWARILSDEVASPGSYSLRTIKTLETMTKKDADNFIRICNIAFYHQYKEIYLIPSSSDLITKMGVDFLDVIALQEIGLLSSGLALKIVKGSMPLQFDSMLFKYNGKNDISIGIHTFTTVANQLYSLVDITSPKLPNDDVIEDLFQLKSGDGVSIHKLLPDNRYLIQPLKIIQKK